MSLRISDPCGPGESPVVDQRLLVTGGAGAFGWAFVQRALDDGARKVVVYSRSESTQAAMRSAMPDDRLRFVIGDVRSAERIYDACRGIDLVIHAAALKRVEVCEADPNEAIATNITGTANVARACIERGVRKAVFLSTDKAAAPNTLYGSTKMVAERLWTQSNVYAAGTPTRLSATRYGNVIGSTGSVVPTWRAQATSGVISITDPAMSRFFMPMADAVDLVLLALNEMRGGEVFVPKIGSATVRDLALAVAPSCQWLLTGPRPSEKTHELLISADEARHAYDAGGYYVIEPSSRTWGDVAPLPYPRVAPSFEYRSDAAAPLTPDALRALVAA